MENNNISAGGNQPDLLSAIYGIEIKNEEKVSEQDRIYCEKQQEKASATLNQLKLWYDIFTANAVRYKESHKLSYAENGSAIKTNPHIPYSEKQEDYTDYEFMPFDSIDKVVELRYKAINAFAADIVRYFNCKYNVSVPLPKIDEKTISIDFQPAYQTYVNMVVAHLGGKGFREAAVEELIDKFLAVVKPGAWSKVKPELKGDKIVFPDQVRFSDYSWEKENKITYSNLSDFNNFCAGIYYDIMGILNGNYTYIVGFDSDNVDFSKTYNMTVNGAVTIKFFKNGRVDVKFKERHNAEACFRKLRLNTIEIGNRE